MICCIKKYLDERRMKYRPPTFLALIRKGIYISTGPCMLYSLLEISMYPFKLSLLHISVSQIILKVD